jgi:glucose-1-phosphate adenylyltransferase
VQVGERAVVGGDGDVTLVGRRARVQAGSEVPAGARLPDPDDGD